MSRICSQVVPAGSLAEALEPLLEKLDRELAASPLSSASNFGTGHGAIDVTAERAAAATDVKAPAYCRRLYEIRNAKARGRTTTNLTIAEALLIALGSSLDDTDLPVLAGSSAGAEEMADVWAEDWSEEDRAVLARKLHNFSRGYADALLSDLPETICFFVSTNSRVARRLLEADGSVVSDRDVQFFQHFARAFRHVNMPKSARQDSLRRSQDDAYMQITDWGEG